MPWYCSDTEMIGLLKMYSLSCYGMMKVGKGKEIVCSKLKFCGKRGEQQFSRPSNLFQGWR